MTQKGIVQSEVEERDAAESGEVIFSFPERFLEEFFLYSC